MLKALLLDSDNLHRPRLDMQHLQEEYGQDIADFLLSSTCTRRCSPDNALTGVLVRLSSSMMFAVVSLDLELFDLDAASLLASSCVCILQRCSMPDGLTAGGDACASHAVQHALRRKSRRQGVTQALQLYATTPGCFT